MNKSAFVRAVNQVLRDNDIKKPVSIPKHVFHISDDDGNSRDFSVKKRDKTAAYTIGDVENIVDACICVIEDALKNGESVSIYGFGTLGLKFRKPRRTKNVSDGQEVFIPGHYIPKFTFGKDLKMCAKTFDLFMEDKMSAFDPTYSEDIEEGGE